MTLFFCSLVSVVRVDGSSMSDIVSTGLLKVVWIGCLGLTAGDWFMESSKKSSIFQYWFGGRVVVLFLGW